MNNKSNKREVRFFPVDEHNRRRSLSKFDDGHYQLIESVQGEANSRTYSEEFFPGDEMYDTAVKAFANLPA